MLFRKKCNHNWEVIEKSNVLQQDDMGYPLRLFVVKCKKCGAIEQQWIDVHEVNLKELDTGESVLCIWKPVSLK